MTTPLVRAPLVRAPRYREEVLPTMAGLLDLDVRSMENPEGFGCFGCHAQQEEAQAL